MSINFKDIIYSPQFSLDGVHLVEASAGTGKTYNIQNIYARLIMEKGFQVSQIQVMTFTEAATKELRERLRAVLKDLQARLNHQDCNGKDDSDKQQRNERADKLIQCAPEPSFAKQQIDQALLVFDEAAISTIHGFCCRALSRFAFETRMSFTMDINENKTEELTQRTIDWWQSKRLEAPQEIYDNLTLEKLHGFIDKLSEKPDWELHIPPEADKAEAYLFRAAEAIINDYEKDRCNRSSQTYDDLLRSMREALNGPFGTQFGEYLREDFKAALIDEFQDTDPVQYDIIQKAFLCDKNFPVFFVGDPKQAIYSFRGGDIFTYRQAKQAVPQEHQYYLDQNFRSTPRLMDAVNAIFHDRDNHCTFQDEAITYKNNILASNKEGLLINGQKDSAPFKVINQKAPQQFDTLAYIIAQILNNNQKTVSPKDIAILVDKHDNAIEISTSLKARHIPYVLQKPGNVFTNLGTKDKSTLAQNFQSVLKAIVHSNNIKQIRLALLTPFFGYSPEEIFTLSETQTTEWLATFRALNQRWQKYGFTAMLTALETATAQNGATFQERLMASPDGQRHIADYHQIINTILQTLQNKRNSPDSIIEWLDKRLDNCKEDDEEYNRDLNTDDDAVKIMTIHISKGLEFPLVFVPKCNFKNPKAHTPSAYHDPTTNKLIFDLHSNQHNADEQKQEKIRLLYVAMTRAIQHTVIFKPPKNVQPILKDLLSNAKNNINTSDSPILEQNYTQITLDNTQYAHTASSKQLVNEPEPPAYDHRPNKGSYSSLSPRASLTSVDDKDRDQDDAKTDAEGITTAAPIFHIRGGKSIGSCWHEILEKISFQATDEEIRQLSNAILKSYGFTPDTPVADGPSTMLEVTSNMIRRTFEYPLSHIDGTTYALKDITNDKRISELEFNVSSANASDTTGPLGDIMKKYWAAETSKKQFLDAITTWNYQIPKGFLNGYMDLLYEYNGAYYIVDWKSNSLNGNLEAFDTDGLIREMTAHGYFFQYLLYAAILQKYLKETMKGNYSWEKHFGGIRYVFLRGIAAGGKAPVYSDRPSEAMLDELAEKLCGTLSI